MSIVTPSVVRLQKYCVVSYIYSYYIAQTIHCTYMLFAIKTISNFVNVLHLCMYYISITTHMSKMKILFTYLQFFKG